ncbi:long-chain-fatty-acid--CoA ligase [Desulfoluna spongiiphila]|uniref:Fatty-acyl-CoA synthase n=1 Tax=Desulfoluna spongiiphila TaxID=419481 RepID=A0A1G5GU02_9BACT|nr:long-chain-fatty-acid--CoA ligase [Desulfoluna spongiiphila]SCY54819.1 fatty-acyl-CoA synthase [Desulfoluna spongiiphila]VVS92900.1 amp-dependent synthetase/ligase [Desulfoluna spongiiphila]
MVYQPGEPYDYPLIIKKLLNTPLIYSPEQEIVYRDQVRFTYRDLRGRIGRLGSVLQGLGVTQGDVVAVMDYDSHRFLECFFGVPMTGAVLQMVNWRLSLEQMVYTVNHARARVLMVNTDFLPLLEAMRPRLETVESVVLMQEGESRLSPSFPIAGDYDGLLEGGDPEHGFPDLDEDTVATTFYTTGTTGNPKGVSFTHRQLVLHTLSGAVAVGAYDSVGRFRSGDVYMPLTPMFHVHAWGMPYLATLLGVKQVYPGKYEPAMLLKLIVGEKVTFSHCVPTILQMITANPAVASFDLSHWKVVIGGARLPRGLAEDAWKMGIKAYAGFGMSETCPLISLGMPGADWESLDRDTLMDTVVKTGRPVPLAEVEVVDEVGRFLPHDGVSTGELVFRAPWLTQGYVADEERSTELWRDGWLYSGDVGVIDGDGYIQITDRMKDVIKTGGEWISSLDLENILSRHEAVLESAAIGVPHEKWGERPMMIVHLKPEYVGAVGPEDLKAYLKGAAEKGDIPRYGVPDAFEFVDDIPKTSVGKLDKKRMRSAFG